MKTAPCTNFHVEVEALRRELEEANHRRPSDSSKLEVLYRGRGDSVSSRFTSKERGSKKNATKDNRRLELPEFFRNISSYSIRMFLLYVNGIPGISL